MTTQERIAKMEETIIKIKNTINRWETRLEKLEKQQFKYPYEMNREAWWKLTDEQRQSEYYGDWLELWHKLDECRERIQDNNEKLNEKIKALNELHEKVKKEAETDASIPLKLVEFGKELVAEWDAFDAYKKPIVEERYKEFCNAYDKESDEHRMEINYRCKTKIQDFGISYQEYYYYHDHNKDYWHKQNVKDAKNLVLALMGRVKKKCGNIHDFDHLHVQSANQGICLNGKVIGDKGTAYVESIMAGGYNIQRLHIRVLVK